MRCIVLLALLSTSLATFSQSASVVGNTAIATPQVSTKIVPGATVYIEKMNGFENYLAAAFAKKKVRLVLVADKDKADYLISGISEDKKAGWAKIVFMGDIHSDADASVTMIDTKSSAVVFAYAVNKKEHYARKPNHSRSSCKTSGSAYRGTQLVLLRFRRAEQHRRPRCWLVVKGGPPAPLKCIDRGSARPAHPPLFGGRCVYCLQCITNRI